MSFILTLTYKSLKLSKDKLADCTAHEYMNYYANLILENLELIT